MPTFAPPIELSFAPSSDGQPAWLWPKEWHIVSDRQGVVSFFLSDQKPASWLASWWQLPWAEPIFPQIQPWVLSYFQEYYQQKWTVEPAREVLPFLQNIEKQSHFLPALRQASQEFTAFCQTNFYKETQLDQIHFQDIYSRLNLLREKAQKLGYGAKEKKKAFLRLYATLDETEQQFQHIEKTRERQQKLRTLQPADLADYALACTLSQAKIGDETHVPWQEDPFEWIRKGKEIRAYLSEKQKDTDFIFEKTLTEIPPKKPYTWLPAEGQILLPEGILQGWEPTFASYQLQQKSLIQRLLSQAKKAQLSASETERQLSQLGHFIQFLEKNIN
jgi:hypothetical protein